MILKTKSFSSVGDYWCEVTISPLTWINQILFQNRQVFRVFCIKIQTLIFCYSLELMSLNSYLKIKKYQRRTFKYRWGLDPFTPQLTSRSTNPDYNILEKLLSWSVHIHSTFFSLGFEGERINPWLFGFHVFKVEK